MTHKELSNKCNIIIWFMVIYDLIRVIKSKFIHSLIATPSYLFLIPIKIESTQFVSPGNYEW